MANTVGGLISRTSLSTRVLGKHSGIGNFLNPGARVASNLADGQPLTARSLLDPAGAILQAPPKPPAPPPVFPDVEGAALNARRRVRRSAAGGGVGSTILTGGYSPTGQAAAVLGSG